jgi:hypothetical protein
MNGKLGTLQCSGRSELSTVCTPALLSNDLPTVTVVSLSPCCMPTVTDVKVCAHAQL